ncbi:septum site-determining protein MinC [Bombella sp. TMW 2.2559]|uniref:Probable septum site-determining protein MinC n=1 Tax=Bombella dulcis TaxID=2967339 RepID=A0ABT3WEV5_9PROT|nr:septum site-determining protein MinC [Bombella dulcis]MCX5616755.1 septum site-determining protein MinC [Bombella dulcis]
MTIRARGRSFLALILSPEPPLKDWLAKLDEHIKHAIDFFHQQPIILDLSLLNETTEGLASFQEELRQRHIHLIGIEGGNKHWEALEKWEWPLELRGGRPQGPMKIPEHNGQIPPLPTTSPLTESLVIDRVVRSGQSIQHSTGDVIVLGAVSSGAEVIAGGSIHVYGPLRGRAIAGINGHPHARIYTTRMEAELLAIDGFYMVPEEMPNGPIGQAAQIFLDKNHVKIVPIKI